MTKTTQNLMAEVRNLAPELISRAAEIEDLRHVPLDLIGALKSVGVFRMLVPQSHGGLELDLPSALEIIRTLAKIDGSVGWNAIYWQRRKHVCPLTATRDLRSHLCERSRHNPCRFGPTGRDRREGRGPLASQRNAGPSPAVASMPNGWWRCAK
jgi:Acyl-CoA dehydrogenase, N-terminal domain